MRYETSVVINLPLEEVWAFTKDLFFNLPRGSGWALVIRQTSPGPIGVGTTFQQRVVILGFEARLSGVFTEWEPLHSLTFSLTGAGLRSGFIRATTEATADGTKLVGVIEFEPRPAFKPLWWIAWPFLKRRWDVATPNVKRLFEAGRG